MLKNIQETFDGNKENGNYIFNSWRYNNFSFTKSFLNMRQSFEKSVFIYI